MLAVRSIQVQGTAVRSLEFGAKRRIDSSRGLGVALHRVDAQNLSEEERLERQLQLEARRLQGVHRLEDAQLAVRAGGVQRCGVWRLCGCRGCGLRLEITRGRLCKGVGRLQALNEHPSALPGFDRRPWLPGNPQLPASMPSGSGPQTPSMLGELRRPSMKLLCSTVEAENVPTGIKAPL